MASICVSQLIVGHSSPNGLLISHERAVIIISESRFQILPITRRGTIMGKNIAEKIAKLRKERKLTQEQLGELLGISGQAVSKWENGSSLPDILLLPDLCSVLGISLDDLLDVPESYKRMTSVEAFYNYAVETGRARAATDVVARLLERSYFISPGRKDMVNVCANDEQYLVHDYRGMSFVISDNDYKKACLDIDTAKIADYFRILTDEPSIEILKIIAAGGASLSEISEKLGLEINEVKIKVLELSQQNFIGSEDTTAKGRERYVAYSGILAVWMCLAGCLTINTSNSNWFTDCHEKKEG